MNDHEELVHFGFVEVVTLLSADDTKEPVIEEVGTQFILILNLLLKPCLEVTIDDSQEQVHNEKQAEDEVSSEEDEVHPAHLIRWQHYVRVIGCRHQNKHVVERITEIRHVKGSLQRARENLLTDPTEVDVVGDDKQHHRYRIIQRCQVLEAILAQCAEKC